MTSQGPKTVSALMVLLVCCALIGRPGDSHAAPKPAKATPAATQQVTPMAFIKGLYAELNRTSAASSDLEELHAAIGRRMETFMDYRAMATRTLASKRWGKLSKAQRKEFQQLLAAMVRKTYVQRFKPKHEIRISYDDKVRLLKDGRAQVRTTIEVGRSSADVYYSMHNKTGRWRVYDIVVDEASQAHIYRRSFARILKKEGWKGLIDRMRKSAGPSSRK